MLRYLTNIAYIVGILGLSGCAGLGKMKEVKFESEIDPGMTM
ncbi:MAG: hypothetical protein ACI9Y1_001137 [Lentisphaeria bacterium]|jgi:hypothetical protein